MDLCSFYVFKVVAVLLLIGTLAQTPDISPVVIPHKKAKHHSSHALAPSPAVHHAPDFLLSLSLSLSLSLVNAVSPSSISISPSGGPGPSQSAAILNRFTVAASTVVIFSAALPF
ncbi:hypothetical protein AAHE18_01G115100 [Arachis hypogaea]